MNMNRIILADDHYFIRLGLIQILKDEYPDCDIKDVCDGDALFKEVVSSDWDLVISDLDMPGRGGLEVLEQIKSLKPNLPVLILSIYPENLYGVRVLKAGASGYISKNAVSEELIKAVKLISSGKKYITSDIAESLIKYDSQKLTHELLSNREFEIFKLLASGKTTSQISEIFSLALTTVSSQRGRIMEKLHLSSNSDLTRYAINHHIISDIGI